LVCSSVRRLLQFPQLGEIQRLKPAPVEMNEPQALSPRNHARGQGMIARAAAAEIRRHRAHVDNGIDLNPQHRERCSIGRVRLERNLRETPEAKAGPSCWNDSRVFSVSPYSIAVSKVASVLRPTAFSLNNLTTLRLILGSWLPRSRSHADPAMNVSRKEEIFENGERLEPV
jgi:hypothetical protein